VPLIIEGLPYALPEGAMIAAEGVYGDVSARRYALAHLAFPLIIPCWSDWLQSATANIQRSATTADRIVMYRVWVNGIAIRAKIGAFTAN
jgi:hypothetical protein